jgi:hypothetical protein
VVRACPPRAQNDYATHLPLLLGLARILKIHRVLEFGSGIHSTLTFLDRSAYPDLQAIVSWETDPDWQARVEDAARHDARLKLCLRPEPLELTGEELRLLNPDLVLVDNSTTIAGREATIAQLARLAPALPPVVIHDFEVAPYRRAARGFPHRFECSAFCPSTGVVWGDGRLSRTALQWLSRVIREHRQTVDPADVKAWTAILNRHVPLQINGGLS